MAQTPQIRPMPIPRGIATVDQAGMDALMREGAANSALAHEIVAQFDHNPKALVAHLFVLSPVQFVEVARMSDADVRAFGQPLIDAVNSNHYRGWTIQYPAGDARGSWESPDAVKASCTCRIVIS